MLFNNGWKVTLLDEVKKIGISTTVYSILSDSIVYSNIK